jgi:hypothetical protein
MRIKPHFHPCDGYGKKTECCGDIEQNYDGSPEWICVEYHKPNGEIVEFWCDGCSCEDCGDKATTTAKDYTGPDTFVLVKTCEPCRDKRENAEPSEPDLAVPFARNH